MMKSGWLALALGVVLLAGCGLQPASIQETAATQLQAAKLKALPVTINAQQAHDQLAADPKVLAIDFSDPDPFAAGHIPGSVNRNLVQVGIWGPKLDKSITIICVDQLGHRSNIAAARLLSMGFTSVELLDGGVAAWQAAGYPLATGTL